MTQLETISSKDPLEESIDSFFIPDKKYFKLQEVCQLLQIKAQVLRAWEMEFPQIRSFKTQNGQRLYRKKDIHELFKLKKLLYAQKAGEDEQGSQDKGELYLPKTHIEEADRQSRLFFKQRLEQIKDILLEIKQSLGETKNHATLCDF